MADKPNNKHATRWIPLIVALLGGIGLGGGGLYLGSNLTPTQIQEIVRPDPFTGTEGEALENRISDLERRVTLIENRILDSDLRELADRIDKLEKQ